MRRGRVLYRQLALLFVGQRAETMKRACYCVPCRRRLIESVHDQRDEIRNDPAGDCQHQQMMAGNKTDNQWIQEIKDNADQNAGDDFFHVMYG
jgi:hypothetical protein